jgi:uncharacterized SAM-binding protein YcdF (DUF218 family)
LDFDVLGIIKTLVLPPGAPAAVALLGLVSYRWWRMIGLGLLAIGAVSMWILSTPISAWWFASALESFQPLDLGRLPANSADAIVILGGGRYRRAPEFSGRDEVSRLTLERLRYGARVHRATGLEIAVSGGSRSAQGTPEAQLMRGVLEADFGVPVRWVETESRNTAENARISRERFTFDTIILVTHAMHMPRAARAFETAGFSVIPAALGFVSGPEPDYIVGDFLPTYEGLFGTHYAMYEYLGAMWHEWSN